MSDGLRRFHGCKAKESSQLTLTLMRRTKRFEQRAAPSRALAGNGDIGNFLHASAASSYPATRQEIGVVGGSLTDVAPEVCLDNPTEFDAMQFKVLTATQNALVLYTRETGLDGF